MSVDIRVGPVGESVVEVTISKWFKAAGDTVKAGELLVEFETDKVNVEVPAETSGVLQQITKAEGETVGIGEVIGVIGEASANGAGAPQASAPAAASTPAPVETPTPTEAAPANTNANGHATPATPTAEKMAQANNIDLATVKGTMPGGRIGKDDVANQIERVQTEPATAINKIAETPASATPTANVAPPAAKPPVAAPAPSSTANGRPEERIKMTNRRKTIATRLVQAQQTAAMLTTFNEIDMTAVMEIRKRRKEDFQKRNNVGLGFMSFFTKASVGALKAFPYVNAEIQGDEIVLKHYYDIGIAVGSEQGLVVPVVRDTDALTFAGIEKSIGSLATKAKDNTLALSDLQGGTFTITNGGIFGSLMSTPILNAPQVGILGLHAIKERAVVVDGQIVARPMMYVALSYDHRIIDGSTAVRFLVRIKELIEDPETLLLEG